MAKQQVKWGRRVWLAIVGLALLAFVGFSLRPERLTVDLGTVSRGPMAETLRDEGEARIRERFAVSAPVAGRVLRNDLEIGDPVVEGETVLATFVPSSPVPLDQRSRAEAMASLEAAEAALGRFRAEIERARGEVQFAEVELQRFQALVEQGIVSTEDLQRGELALSTARQNLQAAQFAERSAAGEQRRARARLMAASLDADPGETLEIRSPIHGVVLAVLRESEAVVPVGEPLVEVGDPEDLEVVVDFLSSDAVAMEPGQPVRIEDWGGPVLDAVVRIVEPTGFTKISALGVEEQRVNVRIDLLPRERRTIAARLGDGYRVVAAVDVWQSADELRMPIAALFRRGDQWGTFVVNEGGVIQEASLEVGRHSSGTGGYAQVLDGVEDGQRVVLHPGMEIGVGRRVRLD
jgi:HlyD family secretion protein